MLLASSDDIAEGGCEIPNGVAVNESLRCDALADERAGVLPPVPQMFSFLLICNTKYQNLVHFLKRNESSPTQVPAAYSPTQSQVPSDPRVPSQTSS